MNKLIVAIFSIVIFAVAAFAGGKEVPPVRTNYYEVNFDPAKIFPDGHDTAITSNFNTLILKIEKYAIVLRQALDGAAIYEQMQNAQDQLSILKALKQAQKNMPELNQTLKDAQKLIELYPASPAAEALKTMISLTVTNGKDPEQRLALELERILNSNLK